MAKVNPIRYAGYYYDEETKNYYLQARYYNPANGAFLALDPYPGEVVEPLSQNGYTYGNNNPVMNIDPKGNASKSVTLKERLLYGFKMAIKLLIQSWGVPVTLGAKIVNSTASFIAGSIIFRKFAKKEVAKHLSYKQVLKQFAGSFTKTIIKDARKEVIKAIGKKALKSMAGGLLGIALVKVGTFLWHTFYYAYTYKK